ncbi:MAG: TM2 domain-containing protein [Gemmatimonadetes bacterium]|nr:TM2 domain-containing protein [Gemmatimonadota bacterium]
MPETSPYSRGVALALSVTLGVFGAHRFYTGKVGTGLAMLCTFGGLGFWYLYDLILVASGEFRDAENRVVYHWSQFDRRQRPAAGSRQVEELQDQMDQMRREMTELGERVDFTERMLAQQRERGKLPRG